MYSKEDKDLGMDRKITRRDFLNGVAITVGAAAISSRAFAQGAPDPARLTGLRGQYEGVQSVMHAVRHRTFRLEPGSVRPTKERYDLVVVGAGISGLAAAFPMRKKYGPRLRPCWCRGGDLNPYALAGTTPSR